MRSYTRGVVALVVLAAVTLGASASGPVSDGNLPAVPPLVPAPTLNWTGTLAAVTQLADTIRVRQIENAIAQLLEDVRQLVAVAVTQRVPNVPEASGGGGSCYDGPIPAYIVTRESGGNPEALNPSGAYGCFQIMPYVWAANCSDLDRGVAGQIECANRISDGGTNLRPWAL